MEKDTIYNDREKRKRTKEKLAKHFAPTSDEPTFNDKVKGLLGFGPKKKALKNRLSGKGY